MRCQGQVGGRELRRFVVGYSKTTFNIISDQLILTSTDEDSTVDAVALEVDEIQYISLYYFFQKPKRYLFREKD